MKRLRWLGARKFVVVGVGPLGCIPYVRATRLIPEGECSIEVNSVVRGYNSKLKEGLNRLNREVGFGAVFVYANSYDVFRRMIRNYHQYGELVSYLLNKTRRKKSSVSFLFFSFLLMENFDLVLCWWYGYKLY